MQPKSNTKLYTFIGAAVLLAVVMVALAISNKEQTAPVDNTKGLAEWAVRPEDQEAWQKKANPDLGYEEVIAHPIQATHQVVCWTGRMQEVVHVQDQQALMVTYQSISAQSFVALMPDKSRFDWQAPMKGVRIQVCGELLGLDTAPTPTLGNQPQPVIRSGFYVEKVGS